MNDEDPQSTWRFLLADPYHELVRPFVEIVIAAGLNQTLYGRTCLSALTVSAESLWHAPGPRLIVRPTHRGFHVEGFDPDTHEVVCRDALELADALELFTRLLAYFRRKTPAQP